MTDMENMSPWRKRFHANRVAFESLLFEKELVAPAPEKRRTGLLVLLALFSFHAFLLTQAVLRGGNNFQREDAVTIETAYKYAQAIDAGRYAQVFKPESFMVSGFKPPLYHLTFYPLLKLFPSSPALALAGVNSFYLLLIMLSLYFSVRKGRNAPSAWFAASLVATLPFVISMGRHASTDFPLMAFVAGAYCCYINSEGFELPGWSFLFGLCFSLGLLCDVRYIVYVLPLVPFALNAFLNNLTRRNTKALFVLLLLLPAPWYLRNFLFSFLSGLFVSNNFAAAAGIGSVNLMNVVRDLPLLVDAMHLPLFVLGVVSLIWLWVSIFMAYEEKELLLVWFLLPYCIFSVLSRAGSGNIYPTLLPFALAAGIMMPNKVRKPLLGLTLLLAVLYQSGFVPEVSASVFGRPSGLFGLSLPRGREHGSEEALGAIRSARAGAVKVQVVGEDEYFNPDSLRLTARRLGYDDMRFACYPLDYMGLADFVLYKTAGFSSAYTAGTFKEYSDEIDAPGGWFSAVFTPLASFDCADTAKVTVYGKSRAKTLNLSQGTHSFSKLSLGVVSFEDAIADVGTFDKERNVYDSLEIFVPHYELLGVDLYSIRLRLEGLSAMPMSGDFSELRLTGCESMRIVSLKMREESVNALLKAGSGYFQNLRIRLDNGLSILATYHSIAVDMGFSVVPTGAGFNLRLTRMVFGGLSLKTGENAAETGADEVQEEETPEPEPELAAGRSLSDVHKNLAQYVGDKTVSDAMKIAGYDTFIKKATEVAKGGKQKREPKAPARPAMRMATASGDSLLSSVLVRLFSMQFDFLDESALPFKLKVSKVRMKNGLLVLG